MLPNFEPILSVWKYKSALSNINPNSCLFTKYAQLQLA